MPPVNEPFEINNVWASNTPVSAEESLELPSGQKVIARRIGMEGLIEAGILSEVDSLSALVGSEIVEPTRKPQDHKKKASADNEMSMAEVLGNPDLMRTFITLADKAVPIIVIAPRVELHYINVGKPNQRMLTADERKPGRVYTDQIDFFDKMFLFEWAVGDLSNLHNFRNSATGDVDTVDAQPSVPRPAKRARKTR